jgi:hypothetical protein
VVVGGLLVVVLEVVSCDVVVVVDPPQAVRINAVVSRQASTNQMVFLFNSSSSLIYIPIV